MKKFNELFKRVLKWEDLVEGKKYHVICTGSDWINEEETDCLFVCGGCNEDYVLEACNESGYFTEKCLDGSIGDFMIIIFEYLEV